MKGNSPLFERKYNFFQSSHDVIPITYSSSSSSLGGASQPYRKAYSVYSKMKKKDIKHGIYDPRRGGYQKNPTAVRLSDMLHDGLIGGRQTYFSVPYVVTTDGDVIIGKRNGNGPRGVGLPTPHPTLIGGLDPKVKMAGILVVKSGKILSYDDRSGHYRPNIKSMKHADEALSKFPKSPEFKGGH